MKVYRRDRRENGLGYAPDRAAALLWSAVTVGLLLLWIVEVWAFSDRSRLGEWLLGNWITIGYWFLDAFAGIVFCVGVHAGLRWGFVGKAFHGTHHILAFVYYRQSSPVVLVEVVAIGYCLLRLWGPLGSRPARPLGTLPFLPDRLVGYGFVLLNVVSAARIVSKGPPGSSWPVGFYLWFAESLAGLVWFDLSVAKSRGWTVFVGIVYCAMGVLDLSSHPEERVQWYGAWIGLMYFSARLAGLGPRPKGNLGLASD